MHLLLKGRAVVQKGLADFGVLCQSLLLPNGGQLPKFTILSSSNDDVSYDCSPCNCIFVNAKVLAGLGHAAVFPEVFQDPPVAVDDVLWARNYKTDNRKKI